MYKLNSTTLSGHAFLLNHKEALRRSHCVSWAPTKVWDTIQCYTGSYHQILTDPQPAKKPCRRARPNPKPSIWFDETDVETLPAKPPTRQAASDRTMLKKLLRISRANRAQERSTDASPAASSSKTDALYKNLALPWAYPAQCLDSPVSCLPRLMCRHDKAYSGEAVCLALPGLMWMEPWCLSHPPQDARRHTRILAGLEPPSPRQGDMPVLMLSAGLWLVPECSLRASALMSGLPARPLFDHCFRPSV